MAVAIRIGGGRGEDAVAGESLGDGVQPTAGQVLGEDALDDRGGDRVGCQLVKALAGRRLAGVGVGAGVCELVAVGGSAAEEAALAAAWAAMAVRTRILMRFRSPLDMPP